MKHDQVTISKAKRTKEGFQISFEYDGDIYTSVKFNRPPHPDLVAALARCVQDVAFFDERQITAQRPITCTGIVVTTQGEGVGISYTAQQDYAKAGQAQGFATPPYWYTGEKQVMNPDQKARSEQLLQELQMYVSREKLGQKLQADLFDDEKEPDAGEAMEGETVKGAKDKRPLQRMPTITAEAKRQAEETATRLRRWPVSFEEFETHYQDKQNMFTVQLNGKLLGYIKVGGAGSMDGSYFERSQAIAEELKGKGEPVLEGDEAVARAKKDKVRRPTKLIDSVAIGQRVKSGKIVFVVHGAGYDPEVKEWVFVGTDLKSRMQGFLAIDKNIETEWTEEAPAEEAPKGDFKTTDYEGGKQMCATFEKSYTSVRDQWNGGDCADPNDIEEVGGKLLVQAREFFTRINGSVELGAMDPDQGEELGDRMLDVIKRLDSLNDEMFTTNKAPETANEFENEFEQAPKRPARAASNS